MFIRQKKLTQEQVEGLEKLLLEGVPIKRIAIEWEVWPTAVYYRARTQNIDLKKMKNESSKLSDTTAKEREADLKAHSLRSYYYYLNQQVKKGVLDKKKMRVHLATFYKNKKIYADTCEDIYEKNV